jgi:hypothetical protein
MVYYIDSLKGDDNNSGTRESDPWRSLEKVTGAGAEFQPEDKILFKRGCEWRGSLVPGSGSSNRYILYGAYGEGADPVLNGSVELSAKGQWDLYGGSLWMSRESFQVDVGNLIFDDFSSIASIATIASIASIGGVKKWKMQNLSTEGDFFYNERDGKIYLLSRGNPASFYRKIEAALNRNVISFSHAHHVIFENLHVKRGGAHGFQGTHSHHIIIRNCEISQIGGGLCPGMVETRFGNGIEFWGTNRDQLVEKCRIHDIYDTAVTNQNHSGEAQQERITYRDNYLWNCAMYTIEIWNNGGSGGGDGDGGASTLKDIRFEFNTSLYPGCGWGIQRVDRHGYHLNFGKNTAETGSVILKNNIFYEGNGFLIADLAGEEEAPWWNHIDMDENCYYSSIHKDKSLWLINCKNQFDASFNLEEFERYKARTKWDLHSVVHKPDFAGLDNHNFQLTVPPANFQCGVRWNERY